MLRPNNPSIAHLCWLSCHGRVTDSDFLVGSLTASVGPRTWEPHFQQTRSPARSFAPQYAQKFAGARAKGVRAAAPFALPSPAGLAGGVARGGPSNTVPHSGQLGESSVTRAPQIGQMKPRNTTPRRPKPRSRLGLNSSPRPESNSSVRTGSNSRLRFGLKFRRSPTTSPSPTGDIPGRRHKRCVGTPYTGTRGGRGVPPSRR